MATAKPLPRVSGSERLPSMMIKPIKVPIIPKAGAVEAMFRKKEPVIKAWDQFGMVA